MSWDRRNESGECSVDVVSYRRVRVSVEAWKMEGESRVV